MDSLAEIESAQTRSMSRKIDKRNARFGQSHYVHSIVMRAGTDYRCVREGGEEGMRSTSRARVLHTVDSCSLSRIGMKNSRGTEPAKE